MSKHRQERAVRAVMGLVVALAPFTADAAGGLRFDPESPAPKVSESGVKAYYSMALTTKPVGNVTITLRNAEGQLTLQDSTGATVLQFTPENYNQPQTVKVGAVNDNVPEGTQQSDIAYQLVSADPGYNNLEVSATTATIVDDDKADVILSESDESTRVKEGGVQDSYTIRLSAQPSADVRIAVSTDASRARLPAQLQLSPASLTFTPANYATPQTVMVTAVDDTLAEGPEERSSTEHLWHTVSSADSAYNLYPVEGDGMEFDVIIDDDDIERVGVEVQITGEDTRVTEGGQGDTYLLSLRTQPATQVTVSAAPAGSDLTVSPASVTFTAENYARPQTITVHAVDDSSPEGWEEADISHSVNSADRAYLNVVVDPVRVSIRDNDVNAVLVTESGGGSRVSEGGEQDSYTLVLTRRPTANVSVYVDVGPQLIAEPSLLTFSAANFRTPQTVTLTAVDDLVVEDVRKETVTHSVHSDDFAYEGVAADDVIVTISDNDVHSVRVGETAGSTQVTEGSLEGDAYTVALGARPDADVEVSVEPGDGLVASPTVLRFTPGNFAAPQTVTVTAVDDAVAQGSRVVMIGHVVASEDPGYDGMAVAPLAVNVEDDDVAALLVTGNGDLAVSEQGATDTIGVRLGSRPASDVVVRIQPDTQLAADPSILTFTPHNYGVEQGVRVSAVDDSEVEGQHFGTVRLTTESMDPDYHGLSSGAVAVIEDNDELPKSGEPLTNPQAGGSRSGSGSLGLTTVLLLFLGTLVAVPRAGRRWNLG